MWIKSKYNLNILKSILGNLQILDSKKLTMYFQTHHLAGKSWCWGDSSLRLALTPPFPSPPPPVISMASAAPSTAAATRKSTTITTVITTTEREKRPRRVREAKPNYREESDTEGGTLEISDTVIKKKRPVKRREEVLLVGDIEDLDFRKDETLEIRASLLNWYDLNQRDLPWRRISGNCEGDGDIRAYAVWVSEVMLQQTRVQTVIGYFNRWMEKWPTLNHLAQATLEEVNEMWAGLGYYRRARFLLEGAKMIVEEGGGFPKSVCALRKVRGIGHYTAGAIASIAFKEAVPVVDGNVVRVIARLKAISANPKDVVTVKNFWKLAGQLVDPCRPGDFNQALMELGATLCTPSSPSCSSCPLSAQCHALSVSRQDRSVTVTDYPTKVVKAKQRCDFCAVSIVEILDGEDLIERPQSESKFLLVKRPDEGLLAGLWEFPSVPLDGEVDLATRRGAIDSLLKKSFNLDTKKSYNVVLREDVGEYVHVFTHIRLKMYIELLVLHLKGGKNNLHKEQDKESMVWKYVNNKSLANMGLTSGVRKAYNMVQKFKQSMFNPITAKQERNHRKET